MRSYLHQQVSHKLPAPRISEDIPIHRISFKYRLKARNLSRKVAGAFMENVPLRAGLYMQLAYWVEVRQRMGGAAVRRESPRYSSWRRPAPGHSITSEGILSAI